MKQSRWIACILCLTGFSVHAQEAPIVLTLDDALAAASRSGPLIKRLEREREISRLDLKRTAASKGITLSLEGGYGHSGGIAGMEESPLLAAGETAKAGLVLGTSSTKAVVAGSHSIPRDGPGDPVSSLAITVNQTLWDGFLPGGKAGAEVEIARLEFLARTIEADEEERIFGYRVREAYYQVLDDQRGLDFRTETLKHREEECRRTAAYLSFKKASSLDMAQAELDRDGAARDLEFARSRLELDKRRLVQLAGLELSTGFMVEDSGDPSREDIDSETAIKIALAERAELREADARIEIARIRIRLADSASSPVLSAEAGADLSRSWPDGEGIGSFSAGLGLALPILDGGLAEAVKESARETLEALLIAKQETERAVSLEAEEAAIALDDAESWLELSARARDQLKARRDLADARFQQGLSSRLDVLQAELELTSGEAGYLASRMGLMAAALRLDEAIGR